jgi:hypothetical protein
MYAAVRTLSLALAAMSAAVLLAPLFRVAAQAAGL